MYNLKTIRKEKGKTQEEMAKIFNIQKQTYQNYELGKREPPFETLIKIANYFNVSIDYLLGRETQSQQLDNYEKELIKEFRELDIIDKGKAIGYVQSLNNRKNTSVKNTINKNWA